jgi:Concanavalin A-like lectin/glucanases superfamily
VANSRFIPYIRSVPLPVRWGIVVLLVSGVTMGSTVMSRRPGGPAAAHRPAASGGQQAGDTCLPRSAAPPAAVKDGYDRRILSFAPVMYLTIGNSSRGAEPDLSGNGHRGTYLPAGDPPATATLPNGDAAAEFNGNGQYLRVPTAAGLSVTRTGCLTVQAWVRPATLQFRHEEGSGYVYILGKGATGKQEYALRMYSRANSEIPERPNRVSAYVFNLAGGKGSGAYFQDRLRAGTWLMVTFVIDDHRSAAWPAGYVAIYKNDQLRGQVSIGQFPVTPGSSDAPLRIGTRQLESYFKGAVGKVAVFDYVLSPGQVRASYDAMAAGPA